MKPASIAHEKRYFEHLRDETFKRAKADGLEIVLPTSVQIQLDIDSPWTLESPRTAMGESRGDVHRLRKIIGCNIKLLDRISLEIGIDYWSAWRSRNGNTHVMITLWCGLDVTERIALQALLGSDPMRELLNLRRVLCRAEDPIALFRPAIGD